MHINCLRYLTMPGKGFTFKQFHVQQEEAAMKVTTDACVFGAWIPGPLTGRLLDAGTGTGLLALMLAQRFVELEITGVELDEPAFHDASLNFRQAPFAKRLRAVNADLLSYVDEVLFDTIVCNPPFFLNAFPTESKPRNMARHASDTFSVDGFLDAVTRLLRLEGALFMILPPVEAEVWMAKAALRHIFPLSICHLRHDPTRKPHRWLIAMRRQKTNRISSYAESELCLFENGNYSEQVRTMLSPFYLYLD